jgi:hypothetical protein
MEDYKRKKKSDKAKKTKDLYGKYTSKKIRELEKRTNNTNTEKIEFYAKK